MKNFLYLLLFMVLVSNCSVKDENVQPQPDQPLITSDYSEIARANLQNAEAQEAYLNKQLTLLDLSNQDIEKASKNTSSSLINLSGSFKRLNNIGNQLFSEGSVNIALFYYISALQLTILNNETEGMAVAYRNLALAYQEIGDYENAAINFWQSFYLWDELGNESRKGQLYNDLGVVYALAYDFIPATSFDVENSTALSFYEAAIDIHQANDDLERIAQAEYNIDVLYTTWLEKEQSSIAKKGWRYEQDDVEDIL